MDAVVGGYLLHDSHDGIYSCYLINASDKPNILARNTMLSPKDISPHGKASSVRSMDSGYGTTMPDDENAFQLV